MEIKALNIYQLEELRKKGFDMFKMKSFDTEEIGYSFFIAVHEVCYPDVDIKDISGLEVIKTASAVMSKTMGTDTATKN